jgi:magnesium-transporting ATPase (P-type)
MAELRTITFKTD